MNQFIWLDLLTVDIIRQNWWWQLSIVGEAIVIAILSGALYIVGQQATQKLRTAPTPRKLPELPTNSEFSDLLVDSSPDGIFAFDTNFRYILWNPSMERMFGIGKAEILHQCAFDVFPSLKETGEDRYFLAAVAGKSSVAPTRAQCFVKDRPLNRQECVECHYSPLKNDRGEIIGGMAVVRETGQRQQAEEQRIQLMRQQISRIQAEANQWRFEFLAQASTLLAASLDYETTLTNVAKLIVPELADWCLIDLMAEDMIERVAVAHIDPNQVELAHQRPRYYFLDPNATYGVCRVLRTGQSELYAHIVEEGIVETAIGLTAAQSFSLNQSQNFDPKQLQILPEIGCKSAMIVPLLARGQILGAITLVASDSERQYESSDLALAEDLANRAALAVDNARIHREAQRARQAAERSANRTALLQRITAALSESLTIAQVAKVVVTQGTASLGAAAGVIALLSHSDDILQIVQAVGYPQDIIDSWQQFHLDTPAPLSDTVRTGEAIFLENQTVFLAAYPDLQEMIARTPYQSWASIPLIIEGYPVGGMGLSFEQPRYFSDDDRNFMRSLAQQCAQAMERAYLYEAEQSARTASEAARSAAEAANRMKDEFLAIVSHELRTPLNSILGWAQLLRSRKFDPTKTAAAIETIERNARSQNQLIEDILDVSRMLRGKLKLEIRSVDLVALIEAVIESGRPAATAKAIQVEFVVEIKIGAISGDWNRLQQVVWNLLSNAIKFTPAGGRVEIRLSAAEKFLDEDDSQSTATACVQIQVTDTGQGINPEFLPYVFEQFRQADSGTTRAYGGLGLGLAIARYLVELHGGKVWAESPGKGLGARFTVQLPLLSGSPALSKLAHNTPEALPLDFSTPLPLATTAARLDGLQVLVVDDEADTREFLRAVLEEYGAKVTAVGSAAEALLTLASDRPDAIVSDIGMPEQDGYSLIRQVRDWETQTGWQIPALALTAYARDEDCHQALLAGFQKHVTKPVEPAYLVEVLAHLTSSLTTH